MHAPCRCCAIECAPLGLSTPPKSEHEFPLGSIGISTSYQNRNSSDHWAGGARRWDFVGIIAIIEVRFHISNEHIDYVDYADITAKARRIMHEKPSQASSCQISTCSAHHNVTRNSLALQPKPSTHRRLIQS